MAHSHYTTRRHLLRTFWVFVTAPTITTWIPCIYSAPSSDCALSPSSSDSRLMDSVSASALLETRYGRHASLQNIWSHLGRADAHPRLFPHTNRSARLPYRQRPYLHTHIHFQRLCDPFSDTFFEGQQFGSFRRDTYSITGPGSF